MFAVALALTVLSPQELPPLSEARFREVFSLVVPSAAELKFDAVDWRPIFWDAVTEAQKQDKPILLWAMNGHPMACT